MNATSNESLGFHARMSQLELRLKESEDERIRLEEKFNELFRSNKLEESKQLFQLRDSYCQLLEQDRLRCQRNDLILQTLNRIEDRTSALTAKTDRLRLLRKYYESYMDRHCSDWRRSDTLKYSSALGSINDICELSPSLRPPSPTSSLFSSSPTPLFTSTPSITRRSSLIVPVLDKVDYSIYKVPFCEVSKKSLTSRKLFEDSFELKTSVSNEKRSSHSKTYNRNSEITPISLKKKSKDSKLHLSPSTLDFEQSTGNDLLHMSLSNDDDSNYLPKDSNSNSLKVEIPPTKNYSSSLRSPKKDFERPSVSIFADNKSAKTSPRTSAKPLSKSSSFSVTSSYSKKPDSYFSSERRSSLMRRPTFAYHSTVCPQPPEKTSSYSPRVASSAGYNRSKSPLGVVDDIFKKYLINYDKRYLSDPISESKYGKYLYPSRSYEARDVSQDKAKNRFDLSFNDFKPAYKEHQLYPSSRRSVSTNHYDSCRRYEPAFSNKTCSTYSGLDSPSSVYSSNDWKDWDHYRNRYQYSKENYVPSVQTTPRYEENFHRSSYSSNYEDTVPRIFIDTSNVDYLDKTNDYQKTFDYQKSKYPTSKTYYDQNLPESWYNDDNRANSSLRTEKSLEQSLKTKDSFKMPQTPKKVSFSNECLYDDGFDFDIHSCGDETMSQDNEDVSSKNTKSIDYTHSNDYDIVAKPKTNKIQSNIEVERFKNKICDNPNSDSLSYSHHNDKELTSQNESNEMDCDKNTKLNDPLSDYGIEKRQQSLTIEDKEQVENKDGSLAVDFVESRLAKETESSVNKTGYNCDENFKEHLEFDIEPSKEIAALELSGNEVIKELEDDSDLQKSIQDELKTSHLETLEERNVAETTNGETRKRQVLSEEERHGEDGLVDNDKSLLSEESYSPLQYLFESDLGKSGITLQDYSKDASDQNFGDESSQQESQQHQENDTQNRNQESYQGLDQNVLYSDINTEQTTVHAQDYKDQSLHDGTAYDEADVPQYGSNYAESHYDTSHPQYEEQEVRKDYVEDDYAQQNAPEYNQVQDSYQTEAYDQINASQPYQQQADAYDAQYQEGAYEQPENYETDDYRQEYEQPAEEQYQGAELQQELYSRDYQGKEGEEHYSPSHYQSEPREEFPAEQYQEEYPQQPVHYEQDYQGPTEEPQQQYEAGYDPAYQEPVYDQTIAPEQYDQYDQQQYGQYEQQPQQYDQYDQSQSQRYDQQPEQYDEYEQPVQQYDQQPKTYDEYEQPVQQYEQPVQQYDQQPNQYDEYEQPVQQYDQQAKPYDDYEQQQQYRPYKQEQLDQPYDQTQPEPDQYNQYEQQQKEQYDGQYQGEPDQYGNYDYGYDRQAITTDQVYPEANPYDNNAQLPYQENVPSSYEGMEQPYGDDQVNYGIEKQPHGESEYLNQDLSRQPQELLPQTSDVSRSPSSPGKTVQENKFDLGVAQINSETMEGKAAPNLSRVLESDPESVRSQGPQETTENSDFDFSSGPK